MADGLSARMLMEHRDAQGVSLFTSQAWRRLFDIRGLLVHELILDFFSTFRFGEAMTDLDTLGSLQFQLGGARPPSYTAIRDSILRLCHRLIGCSIAGRSHAPKKVIVTDLFYLRGMDVGSVNVPYLLARERLRGLTVIAPALLVIDMTELVRLHICMEIDDTWAWAVPPPPRTQESSLVVSSTTYFMNMLRNQAGYSHLKSRMEKKE
ncbi:hypothetical protein Tco_1412684 [Tanacetum coccineum]